MPTTTAAPPAVEPAPAQDESLTPRQHPISRQLHEERTRGERLADDIAGHIGSWRFLIIQSVLVALWIGLNLTGLILRWDSYPFVLLNLLFSVQAAYTGPVLLLSQNRSAQRDRVMAEHDYATNEHAEQLIEALMSELLRNSQAVLAIASFHGIQLQALNKHESDLNDKVGAMQEQLAEVEDVLTAKAAQEAARA
ncbi:DUF1003 domain-containing protein [Streptacidiphilus sp. PB12-B1b]|uniref:DUF1003 domain-containing protein n=1 Tax=Streptacidiphilus sp. PB12-B1b TaxID=2705012 RepID=UPI0015FD4AD2|nr:DUF1003 domain-containing protein [Streptacidiphilus sp. PB12-B1b]QMU77210.1 DUF1003 domain-containing protein [Streptacidiphilus sp. PB12-B1b]